MLLVSFVLVHGCVLPETNQADGSSCSDDDGCKSHRCFEGFCSGGSCKLSDSSSCASGWKCTHNKPDAISDFFGSDGSDTCKPTCGHCPANSYCTKEAQATEGSLCTYGKQPLEITVTATPSEAVVGAPTKLTAVAAQPAGRLVECTWDGGGKPSEKTGGPEITRVFDSAQMHSVRASCKDEGGRSGSAEGKVNVVCVPSGAGCALNLLSPVCCADKEQRCVANLSGEGFVCRVPTPPAITITGPDSVAVNTDVELTASVTGGDGAISSVTWAFSDTSFSKQGVTVTHSFSKAGVKTATAKVATSIASGGEKVHTINVCQISNGRCDTNEPCCAPLTCTGTGTIKYCK